MPLPEEAPAAEPVAPKQAPFFYGGQAVIEGVMMRGRQHYAVAVRMPAKGDTAGEIRIDRGELRSGIYRHPFWKLPFARGLALLVEQLHLGMKALLWSANMHAYGQEIEIGRREMTISVAGAAIFGLGLFIGLPLIAAGFAVHRSGSFGFVLVEGLIRVVLVLGYLTLIGFLRDVRRVFQYHGAEHKTINAFEAGWPLEPAAVKRASNLHPRCGTGFLLVVLVVSVLVFSVVAIGHPDWFWLVVSRIVGIPVIAGLSFEWIRFMARHRGNPVIEVMLLPILGTQKFTTREPDLEQIAVAIAAFNAAREGEEGAAAA